MPKRHRQIVVAFVLCLALAGLLWRMDQVQGISTWLAWTYVRTLGVALAWAGLCFGLGSALIKRLFRVALPTLEHASTALALGVFVFFSGWQLLGFAHLMGPYSSVLYPLALALLCSRELGRGMRSWMRKLRLIQRFGSRRASALATQWVLPLRSVAFGFGVLCLVGLIGPTLSPQHAGYDSQWYHLPLAEHYAAEGGVSRSPEGWIPAAGPHLASVVYSWAFLLPGADLFTNVVQCAHLEAIALLGMLLGVVATFRRLVPRSSPWLSWVFYFCFPNCYYAGLGVEADHFAGIWVVPAHLAVLRAVSSLSPRRCALLATLLSGLLLTKFTGITQALFPVLAVVVATPVSLVRRGDRTGLRTFAGPATALLVGLSLTAFYWLRNWLWYGNPVYPMASSVFDSRPWMADSDALHQHYLTALNRPTDMGGIVDVLSSPLTFSFIQHDWEWAAGDYFYFGSLFTLFGLALPWLRVGRTTWMLYVAGVGAVIAWYWLAPQQRYLVAIAPLLAGVTAALFVRLWSLGSLVRGVASALILVQLVWGASVYWFPNAAQRWIGEFAELMASGYEGRQEQARRWLGPIHEIAEQLPAGSKVLVHDAHLHFGLEARSVNDSLLLAPGADYGQLADLCAVHDKLTEFGVTHIMRRKQPASNEPSIAYRLLFWDYTQIYASKVLSAEPWTLHRMPVAAPRECQRSRVAIMTCPSSVTPGVYPLDVFRQNYVVGRAVHFGEPLEPLPVRPQATTSWPPNADYLLSNPRCSGGLTHGQRKALVRLGRYGELDLYRIP